MKITCISVRQPLASIIVYGPKWCENRSKRSNHVGELWIHASEKWDPSWPRPDDVEAAYTFPCPTGVILGRATMLGCWTDAEVLESRGGLMSQDPRLWEALLRIAEGEPRNFFGWDYVAGPHCYLLADRRPLVTPIWAKGRLGLWTTEVPPDRAGLHLALSETGADDPSATEPERSPLQKKLLD